MPALRVTALGLLVVACGAIVACEAVLAIDDFSVVRDPSGDTCWVPDGSGHGNPCFSCDAGTQLELLNACTTRPSFWFDDRSRIPDHDAGRPPLPDAAVDETVHVAQASTGKPLCKDLPKTELLPPPVYVVGSTALSSERAPALARYAQALLQANKATIVYQRSPSCVGFAAIAGPVPLSGDAVYWDRDGKESTCSFDDGKELAHIGLSDVGGDACQKGFSRPSDIEEALGPIQVFMFMTHKASSENVISREAAHRVYGWGGALPIPPWTVPGNILKRTILSGTQLLIARYIGLPAERWQGVSVASSGGVLGLIGPMVPPESAIAITSGDVADRPDRAFELRVLAYQHEGQHVGFLPDTDRESWDKRNVRDGHYVLWEPLHMFARAPGGVVPDAATRDTLNALRGTLRVGDFDPVPVLKLGGLIPRCAMSVDHDELGNLVPYRPTAPCHCAFEMAAPKSAMSCTACSAEGKCPSGTVCGYGGWCEKP